MKPVNVAVVGATGAVGEVMIEILESRGFPVDTLYPIGLQPISRQVGAVPRQASHGAGSEYL